MNKTIIKTLIIEDHPIVAKSYQIILSSAQKIKFDILEANSCENAVQQINNTKNKIDLFLIDVRLPASTNSQFKSGIDIAIFANNSFPECKIIFITSIDNKFHLSKIIETIPHNGILLKSDTTSKLLIEAIEKIIDNGKYYSKSIKAIVSKKIISDIFLNINDQNILHFLSIGVKNKDLHKYIPLSQSAIEKRKKQIKLLLNISNNEQLLLEAEKRGLFSASLDPSNL